MEPRNGDAELGPCPLDDLFTHWQITHELAKPLSGRLHTLGGVTGQASGSVGITTSRGFGRRNDPTPGERLTQSPPTSQKHRRDHSKDRTDHLRPSALTAGKKESGSRQAGHGSDHQCMGGGLRNRLDQGRTHLVLMLPVPGSGHISHLVVELPGHDAPEDLRLEFREVSCKELLERRVGATATVLDVALEGTQTTATRLQAGHFGHQILDVRAGPEYALLGRSEAGGSLPGCLGLAAHSFETVVELGHFGHEAAVGADGVRGDPVELLSRARLQVELCRTIEELFRGKKRGGALDQESLLLPHELGLLQILPGPLQLVHRSSQKSIRIKRLAPSRRRAVDAVSQLADLLLASAVGPPQASGLDLEHPGRRPGRYQVAGAHSTDEAVLDLRPGLRLQGGHLGHGQGEHLMEDLARDVRRTGEGLVS